MKRMNMKEFKTKLENKYGDHFEIISNEYINNKTPITVKCKKCNHIRNISPNKILTDSKCPKCSKKLKKNTKMFTDEVILLTNGEYDVIGDYINTSTKIKMIHLKCGHEWDVLPKNFLSKSVLSRCPKCSHRSTKYSDIEYHEKLKVLNPEFTVLSDYISTMDNVILQCNTCKTEFKRKAGYSLKTEIKCPECSGSDSVGVQKIKNFLKLNDVDYETEVWYDNLRSSRNRPLFIDFYIPKLDIYIEFDGRQHFHGFHDGDITMYRENDIIKNDFVLKNNKKLLRIRYSQKKNIESILESVLLQSSTTIESYNILLFDQGLIKEGNYFKYYNE